MRKISETEEKEMGSSNHNDINTAEDIDTKSGLNKKQMKLNIKE